MVAAIVSWEVRRAKHESHSRSVLVNILVKGKRSEVKWHIRYCIVDQGSVAYGSVG